MEINLFIFLVGLLQVDFDGENRPTFANQVRGIYNVFTIIAFPGEIKFIHLVNTQ